MSDPKTRRLYAFGTAYLALVLLAAVRLPPIQDETYYWTWGRAPGLSFVDHPPGISYVLAASSFVLGDGLLGLRAPSIISMAIAAAFSVASARRLGGDPSLALLVLMGAPMFAVGYIPGTPDPVQGALAAISAYLVIRALEPNAETRWSFLAAFTLVASSIVKHSSAVLAIGVFIALLASPERRKLLTTPAPWIGVLSAMLVLAPWLYADLFSGAGSSLQFQEARVLSRGTSRGLLAVPIFFGGILLALGPAGGIMLLGSRRMHPLLFGALLLLAVLFVPVLKGGGELNWSMPSLIFALPALETRFTHAARALALASALVLCVILAHVAHPFLPIPANKDTTRRGAGFDEVAKSAKALADQTGARLIITRRYQLASMMRYHMGDALPVLELGSSRRSQYDVWPKPELRPGEIGLLVLGSPDLPDGANLERLEPSEEVIRKSGSEALEALYLTPVRKSARGERGPT